MRLMHSGCDFACIYDRQDQVAFLDGHVRASAFFGFVPRRIVYDNLKAAVKKVQFPKRQLSKGFEALQRHFQFETAPVAMAQSVVALEQRDHALNARAKAPQFLECLVALGHAVDRQSGVLAEDYVSDSHAHR